MLKYDVMSLAVRCKTVQTDIGTTHETLQKGHAYIACQQEELKWQTDSHDCSSLSGIR